MDGLRVYRQYLENIRLSVCNCELSKIEEKGFIPVLNRMKEIEDLSYIDVVLKNAGLGVSFLGDKSFLNEPVVMSLNYADSLEGIVENKDEFIDILSYMNIDEMMLEDSLEELEELTQIPELSLDYFPQSGETYYSPEEFIDIHKETLNSLFSFMDKVSNAEKEVDKKEKEKKERESLYVEEFFDEDELDEIEDFKDEVEDEIEDSKEVIDKDEIEDSKEVVDKEDIEDSKGVIEKEDIEDSMNEIEDFKDESFDYDLEDDIENSAEEDSFSSGYHFNREPENQNIFDKELYGFEDDEDIVSEDSDKLSNFKGDLDEPAASDSFLEDDLEDDFLENRKINTSFLLDDDEDDIESSNMEGYSGFEKKDFSMFVEDEEEIEDEDDEPDEDFGYKGRFFNSSFEDTTSDILSKEVEDNDDWRLRDTDPVDRSIFEEATEYFLKGDNRKSNPIREMYSSKEKIVDMDEVKGVDDALAKMILAISDNMFNIPALFKRVKSNGKKLKNSMRVEDDEDEEWD